MASEDTPEALIAALTAEDRAWLKRHGWKDPDTRKHWIVTPNGVADAAKKCRCCDEWDR